MFTITSSKRKIAEENADSESRYKKMNNGDSLHISSENSKMNCTNESENSTIMENTKRSVEGTTTGNGEKSDKKVRPLEQTIQFLRAVLASKDSFLKNKDAGCKFLDSKKKSIKEVLIEKDSIINNLTQQVKDIALKFAAIGRAHESPEK